METKKGLMFWIGYILGYFKGRSEGQQDAEHLKELLETYGALESIPTRELSALKSMSEELVLRQRVKIALFYINDTFKILNYPIPFKTLSILSDWLEFREIDVVMKQRLMSIGNSDSVIFALFQFINEIDQIDISNIERKLEQRRKGWVWNSFKHNDLLQVV